MTGRQRTRAVVVILAASALLVLVAGCFGGGGSGTMWSPDATFKVLPPPPDSSTWPTASTTGPKGAGLAYTALTPRSSIEVMTNGTVIDKVDVSGRIRVYADNVVIKRSRIRHTSAFGIQTMDGARNLRVEYVEIVGTASTAAANIGVDNYRCFRCNLHGAIDGAKAENDVTIEESYIHSLRRPDGAHPDGIQNSGGDGVNGPVVIRGNAIYGPYQTSTSAILAQTNIGPIDGMIIENNFLYGGSFSVYLRDKGTGNGPPTNSVIRNNTFAERTTGMYLATGRSALDTSVIADSTVTVTGNRWDDGTIMK